MGGMIAQRIAISHAHKVLTLTSIMSSGYALNPRVAKNPIEKVLFKTAPFLLKRISIKSRFTNHEVSVKTYVETYRMLAGTRFPYNEPYFQKLYTWSILERKGQNPKARSQQFSAIVASGSRLRELPKITCPTLVIHGTADNLVPPVHAQIYAPLIPNSQLLWLEGIGHELPNGILPEVHHVLFSFYQKSL
jgi:pimeloyl-ACP methyl ester carboxylesterase